MSARGFTHLTSEHNYVTSLTTVRHPSLWPVDGWDKHHTDLYKRWGFLWEGGMLLSSPMVHGCYHCCGPFSKGFSSSDQRGDDAGDAVKDSTGDPLCFGDISWQDLCRGCGVQKMFWGWSGLYLFWRRNAPLGLGQHEWLQCGRHTCLS